MATISNTPRPGYVWDSTDNVWYPIGVGGHSHPDYITQATAISPTTVDAKGDLLVGSAADTISRLAVGADGSSIVADSSTATGLRYQGNFAAGKNVIINGDFTINQRSFTTTTTANAFGFDRWLCNMIDGTTTYSAQTFTAGAAPVAGYEATNFARVATTGQTLTSAQSILQQKIESVRTFANQTLTVSFWAKATSGTPKVAVEINQNFGSGGSATVTNYLGQVTLSTSWARYSVTVNPLPSVSGKTIGTSSFLGLNLWVSAGSDYNSRTGSLGIQTNTFDFWGVQVEAGSVATAFQTATGTIQGELAACQRYYVKIGGSAAYETIGLGSAWSTTRVGIQIKLPTTMRIAPSSVDYALPLELSDSVTGYAVTTASMTNAGKDVAVFRADVASGLTQFRPYSLTTNNSTSAYVAFSAEL